MTNLPPDDDTPPATPQDYGERFEQEEAQDPAHNPYAQETSQEHAFQSHEANRTEPYRESTGFGFVALVAGLICLAALSGIVIYSLLLAPTPPRQPILIEAEGTTKQAPAEAQVKPEPNSNVGVFRMLRGTDEAQQNANKNTTLIVKPGAPEETTQETIQKTNSTNEDSAAAEQQKTEESEENAETSEGVAALETSSLETSDEKETASKTQNARQKAASVSNEWYVQVAALESRAAADKAWAKMHDQLPELLYTQNYVAKAVSLASGKRVWRLLLGPQPQQQAETLCRELKTRARSCLVKKIAP